jgi:glycosyltransferase involved in cell wall biosynthesis
LHRPERLRSRTVQEAFPKVLWITNLPAPYRFSLWEIVGRNTSLLVQVFSENTWNHHWSLPSTTENYKISKLRGIATAGPTIGPILLRIPWRELLTRSLILGGWDSLAYVQLMIAAKAIGTPVVLFYESTLASRRFQSGLIAAIRRTMLRSADAIVVVGAASREAVLADGVAREQVITGFNSVDVEAFHTHVARLRACAPHRSAHAAIYVGQLIPRKNVESLIHAWAQTARDDDRLSIVGDGPLRGTLVQLTRSLAVDDRVTFHGHVQGERLYEALSRANTLVLPSVEEVWGLVVNEALASGLHVVVSAAAGVSQSVAGMRGVFIVQPNRLDIARGLLASRDAWTGPISSPEILRHTPTQLAEDIVRAMKRACSGSAIRRMSG